MEVEAGAAQGPDGALIHGGRLRATAVGAHERVKPVVMGRHLGPHLAEVAPAAVVGADEDELRPARVAGRLHEFTQGGQLLPATRRDGLVLRLAGVDVSGKRCPRVMLLGRARCHGVRGGIRTPGEQQQAQRSETQAVKHGAKLPPVNPESHLVGRRITLPPCPRLQTTSAPPNRPRTGP